MKDIGPMTQQEITIEMDYRRAEYLANLGVFGASTPKQSQLAEIAAEEWLTRYLDSL